MRVDHEITKGGLFNRWRPISADKRQGPDRENELNTLKTRVSETRRHTDLHRIQLDRPFITILLETMKSTVVVCLCRPESNLKLGIELHGVEPAKGHAEG